MRTCQKNLHLHWHAGKVNGWNFNAVWTLPSGGDRWLETKVRVQSNVMKLWTMLIWGTKALWTLKVISIQRKPRDKHTLAPLCIYNIMPLSCQWTYQGLDALRSAYGMEKKEESILIIIFMSVHIIHLPLMGCLLSSSTFLGDGLALTPLTLMTEVTDWHFSAPLGHKAWLCHLTCQNYNKALPSKGQNVQ